MHWGADKRFSKHGKLANGHSKAAAADSTELNDSKESGDTENAEDVRNSAVTNDPGYNLCEKHSVESEDSQDEELPLHESETLTAKVQTLASALLQIEQGIDGKFIRYPFGKFTYLDVLKKFMFFKGPKRDFKSQKFDVLKQKRLDRWEESLMRSKTYSQVSFFKIKK